MLGEIVELNPNDPIMMKNDYINLLKELSEKYNPNRIEKLIEWLNTTDFFNAPASTKFHDSFSGGLLYHHLNVYNQVVNIKHVKKFENVDLNSAYLIALTHDFCKIGLYEEYSRNVKNENGQWIQVQAYKWVSEGPQFPLGHGVASMYLLSKFIPLTLEESLAIRWHMGEYNCCQNEMSELQNARDEYPLVLMIQTADRLASTNY